MDEPSSLRIVLSWVDIRKQAKICIRSKPIAALFNGL